MTSRIHFKLLLSLVFVVAFSFYYGLGSYGLFDTNEGLYAEIAKEMYSSHQYIIPTLNGVPYIEKPPLLYWLVSACFHMWGTTEFAARFVPATCGAITCFALVFFAQQINRLREGLLAALILSTSLGFIAISRVLFFDMLLTAMFTLCLMSFFLAWFFREENQLRKGLWYTRMGYAFLALAILAKGMVGAVLIALIFASFLYGTHTFRAYIKWFLDPLGVLLFLLIVLPWHLLAIWQHVGFFQNFFINEQLMRFLDKRIPHDYYGGPFYYYLPKLIMYLLPWGLLLPLLGLKKYRGTWRKDPLQLFAWLWFLIPLIFFSVSRAKANYYMVIVCPALALLLAHTIDSDFVKKKSVKLWSYIIISFSALSLVSIPVAAHFLEKHEDRFSLKTMAQTLKNSDPQLNKKTIYFFQNFERISSLRFYLNQPIKLIDSRSQDLWYGSKFAKDSFLTTEEFDRGVKNKDFYVVVRQEELPKFYKKMPHHQFDTKIIFSGWTILQPKLVRALPGTVL
jgi:4-amino-4-deoxy-L-arabinose transferase-like glycosyltransferase